MSVKFSDCRSLKVFISLFVFFAALTLASGTALAADTVGIIDSQKILFQHPNYDAWFWWLAAKNRELVSADQPLLERETDPEKQAQIIQKRNETMQQEEQRVMAPMHKECYDAVASVAQKKKITVVLESSAIYSGGTDITEDVVKYLKANVKPNLPPEDTRFGGKVKGK